MAIGNSESRGLIAWLSSCCEKGGVRFSVEVGVLWTSARGATRSGQSEGRTGWAAAAILTPGRKARNVDR